ncbi:uncharacterized protein DEA37_0007327 [Paragonimus westermani]|uniref:Hakai C2H2 zinc finger domain-containing protein n=1 Tax=Paragonimus westermani TaxID=34504 RepID=A0A5J4P4N3_9TREM|nr:uncharacterized protein DEA37_0007327 [Paragonimus westermani]
MGIAVAVVAQTEVITANIHLTNTAEVTLAQLLVHVLAAVLSILDHVPDPVPIGQGRGPDQDLAPKVVTVLDPALTLVLDLDTPIMKGVGAPIYSAGHGADLALLCGHVRPRTPLLLHPLVSKVLGKIQGTAPSALAGETACQKSVQTVERCLVGGIFMCFENDSCRRTYLSQRDLQAHIDHRHRGGITVPPKSSVESSVATQPIKVALSKPITETSGSTLTSTKTGTNITPVHKDAASLFQSLQRQCNLSVMSSSSTSLTTVGFGTGSKSKGLLPLPTPTSVSLSGLAPRISVSHSIPPPSLGPFPQMMQFSTPPPPIGSRSLVPPSTAVLNPSVPPPSAVRNPSFNAANAAVVALAAAAAAMNTQSKAAGMPIRPDALLSGHPGISGTGHLQPGGLNLSMFSNALLSNQTSWSQANAMGNFTNRLPQPSSAPNSSAGPMNIGRFPF